MVACSIGRQVLEGRSFPGTAPGNGTGGAVPKPACENVLQSRSRSRDSAIFAVPTLLDFWITCATVSAPYECASLMVAEAMVSRPGAVWITVSGVTTPSSIAVAAVKGFMVEPGSKLS